MRALIRGREEYVETAWSGYVRAHLDMMHTQEPAGCGYALAEEYIEGYEWIISVRDGKLYASRGNPKLEDTANPNEASVTETSGSEATEPTLTIGTKTYTMSELEELVNKQ